MCKTVIERTSSPFSNASQGPKNALNRCFVSLFPCIWKTGPKPWFCGPDSSCFATLSLHVFCYAFAALLSGQRARITFPFLRSRPAPPRVGKHLLKWDRKSICCLDEWNVVGAGRWYIWVRCLENARGERDSFFVTLRSSVGHTRSRHVTKLTRHIDRTKPNIRSSCSFPVHVILYWSFASGAFGRIERFVVHGMLQEF